MKKALLFLATATLLVNTLLVPTVSKADTGSGGGNCSGSTSNCKP